MWKQRILFLFVGGLLMVLISASDSVVPVDGQAEILKETKYIALTFDDGPLQGTTDRLLDGLKARGASATFFLVGEQAARYPDLVRRMQEEGHQVGNHTWSHVRLEKTEPIEQEVRKTEEFLETLLGGKDYWLRPPYGYVVPGAESQIKVPMVKWSVDPRDWESRDQQKVVQAVLGSVKPNSIVLLHDIYPTSVDAALEIVDTLQNEGWWFVTVEELLQLNGITPQAGMMYRTGDS